MTPFTNLGDLIRRGRDLDKVAVIDLGGEQAPREFTYRRIDETANGVARALLRRGLTRGERVAILSANRAEYLAAYFGIMRAGLVAVPVNFKFPPATIEFIVRDAGAKLLFCDPPRREDCPTDSSVICFGCDGTESFDGFVEPGPFDAVKPAPDEPAMFLYTSGSTGTPKGVVLTHRGHIWVAETRLGGEDLSRHRYLIAVPPMIAMMLHERELLARTDLSSVEFVRMGSAPVTHGLMQALRRALPRAAVTNAYGTTEAGPVVFGPHPRGLPQPELSVGYPHPQVK